MPSVNKSYDQILEQTDNEPFLLTYPELLTTHEWITIRKQILKRDDYKCKKCGSTETIRKWDETNSTFDHFQVNIPGKCRKYLNYVDLNGIPEFFYIFNEDDFLFTKVAQPISLHIHHCFYFLGHLPWEYEDDCFETLCVNCHFNLHNISKIPVYNLIGGNWIEWKDLTACYRCNGAGHLPEFAHVEGGICFRCCGFKYEDLITSVIKEKTNRYIKVLKNRV